jgi:NTE family protein
VDLSALPITVVFSGGVGLGPYQAGAFATLHKAGLRVNRLAGSSIGAINAALIAGNAPELRVARLREFWDRAGPPGGLTTAGEFRHVSNWLSALQARMFGVRRHFHPRLANPFEEFRSLYDLAPMREQLQKLVDFERLNSGETRVCVATTDIESGEQVVFDTGRKTPLEMRHLLASCGYLPEFPAVEIDGRWLGDGGLFANAPIETALDQPETEQSVLFVVDLFARDGGRPKTLEAALTRKNDLLFGNQTYRTIQHFMRERKLRAELARARTGGKDAPAPRSSEPVIVYLS